MSGHADRFESILSGSLRPAALFVGTIALILPPGIIAREAARVGNGLEEPLILGLWLLKAVLAALAAMQGGDEWQKQAREQYCATGERVAAALGVPAPEGSTFLFVDVADRLDDRGLDGFLEDCFDDGVLVAPGLSSGQDYGSWIRLCYTVMPPKEIEEGIRLLARRVAG